MFPQALTGLQEGLALEMTEAFVTPQLIQWARERSHLAIDTAAEKLTIKPEKLEAWEKEGNERPTFRQAQNLAQKFHIPFGYLFLSAPPEEKLPLPDLRTVAGAQAYPPSPEFTDVLNDVLRKQQWYREYQESEGAQEVPFIGRFTLSDNPETIAVNIRDTLGIDNRMRSESDNWEIFLRDFIQRAESAGILVLRSGIVGNNTGRKLNVEEFRGFAISDNLAPVVFINGQDAKAAQIFTLAHELAHLWIGESGISNPDYRKRSSQQEHIIDRFCDQVAAETLVPKQDLLSYWQDSETLNNNLRALTARYRVSPFVILRRAYENEKVSADDYHTQYQELLADHKRVKSQKGGGNFYRNLLARNSNTLTITLLVAAAEGRVSHRDTARLLNVKVKTLPTIQNELLRIGSANA